MNLNNSSPKVSIVITCYNYAHFLDNCINSVLNQTFKSHEIILVDDGSTDNTNEIVQPYIDNYGVKYIRQINQGQANAKNRGIFCSSGDLIAFLDADDIWESNKLEKQVPLFSNPEVGVVYSRCKHIDSEGRQLPIKISDKYLEPCRGEVSKFLIYDNFIPFSSAIVKRGCLEHLGRFDEDLSMGIDWDLWLRLSTEYHFDFCDEHLLQYRVGHSGQMSKNLFKRLQCAERIFEKFTKNHPTVLPEQIIKDALYYSYCLRGYSLRHYGLNYSLLYFVKAILLSPFRFQAYSGLVKAPLISALRR